jgi:hypothetical protein
MRNLISSWTGIALVSMAALANASWPPPVVSGTWAGQCTRPGKDSANVKLIISGDSSSFNGAPLLQADLSGRTLKFDAMGSGGAVRRSFFGTFSDSFEALTGTYSQTDGKLANCSLNILG